MCLGGQLFPSQSLMRTLWPAAEAATQRGRAVIRGTSAASLPLNGPFIGMCRDKGLFQPKYQGETTLPPEPFALRAGASSEAEASSPEDSSLFLTCLPSPGAGKAGARGR